MTRFEAEMILAAHPELRAPFEGYYAEHQKFGRTGEIKRSKNWSEFVRRLSLIHKSALRNDIFWAVWDDKEKKCERHICNPRSVGS